MKGCKFNCQSSYDLQTDFVSPEVLGWVNFDEGVRVMAAVVPNINMPAASQLSAKGAALLQPELASAVKLCQTWR